MESKRHVAVKIKGRDYIISCTEEEEHVHRVAYYVDKKLNQISNSNSLLSSDTAAILVAVNIADELLKSVKMIEKLKRQIQEPELRKRLEAFYNEENEKFTIVEEEPEIIEDIHNNNTNKSS